MKVNPRRLEKAALPAIAEAPDGSYFVLARVGEGRASVHRPGQRPETVSLADLEQRWTRRLIFLTRRAQLAGEERRFDFTWFIPAIYKYRRLFAEVLTASFFLQLFGLVSPPFFQVVIDKELVRRDPLAHLRIFFKDLAHLFRVVSP
ncbi:MAG: hypothetical protein Kow00114_02770 [Kiloniellaceae bacterium]